MAQVDETADRQGIAHTIHEVARAFDEKRHTEILPGVFTEDASILYRLRGRRIDFSPPDGMPRFKTFHDLCYWTQHLVSPHVLSLDGDTATARTPVHALHLQIRDDGSHNQWVIGATYHDELMREGSRWRIKTRLALCPWVEGDFLMEGVRSFPTLPDYDSETI